jgi:diaminohydroxyphosphoribosylaminopyrimidine deaminase/5-amino-6-(5-phosphoribosylamino)uracil reductase
MNADDPIWMRQALELARLGRGRVEPNPMVGCVIVREGRIIGEGSHRQYGGPHAEREALAACRESAAGATAYVTLEPCCHTNKKTPPCVPALIEAKIGRVVGACADPNPLVSGRGFEQLRSAGIGVEVGILEKEAQQLNAAFFARVKLGRPYVTLKWAQTADRKVAGTEGARLQISGPASMRIVHRLRARCDAILVGIGTVLADDPLLTAREVEQIRPLLRVVLDSSLRIPMASKLVGTARQAPVVVYCASEGEKAGEMRGAGVEVVRLGDGNRPGLEQVLQDLGQRGVTHLLVEGGPEVARSFLEQGLADRAWVFQSPQTLDSPAAPDAPVLTMPAIADARVDGDRVTEHLNTASPVFFDARPSVDFLDLVQDR